VSKLPIFEMDRAPLNHHMGNYLKSGLHTTDSNHNRNYIPIMIAVGIFGEGMAEESIGPPAACRVEGPQFPRRKNAIAWTERLPVEPLRRREAGLQMCSIAFVTHTLVFDITL
jgi:hypothetical protein